MPVAGELLEWADLIFVMERAHRNKLSKRFIRHSRSAKIITLDIPDDDGFMDPTLVRRL